MYMKKLLLIPTLVLLLAFTSNSTTTFPPMACSDLHDKVVSLPKDITGKMSIVVLAASKKTEADLKSWMVPIYQNFIADQSGNIFASEAYDVNTYFVPVFSGVAKTAAKNIKKQMLNGLDPSLQSNVLIYKGNAKELYKSLGMNTKEVALLVVDAKGNLVKKIAGGYTEEKMAAIEDLLSE